MDGSQPLDPRKTIFVGGVPRPLRAGMSRNSDSVVYITKNAKIAYLHLMAQLCPPERLDFS